MNKKGKRKRTTEAEIVVPTKEKEVPVLDVKRKTMEHTITRCDARLPKVTPITDDYEISNHVLGLGINGKVVQCYDKNTREKYALKVRHNNRNWKLFHGNRVPFFSLPPIGREPAGNRNVNVKRLYIHGRIS